MAEANSEKKYLLKKQLRRLEECRGSGTELISVYIPSGSPIHEMGNKLREEMSQAANIKSKSTKQNVIGALERIINHFKLYKKTPPNGVAVFCGNISDNPAKVDMELFAIEPPEPLNIGTYRCDSKFFLEPLQNIYETKDSYGIVVMDGRDATLAIVRGTNIRVVDRRHSLAHAKVNKGGQSQNRYENQRMADINFYHIDIAESMDKAFLNKVKGVIIGGPGPAKEDFIKSKKFNYQIKLLGVVDTGYTDEYGIREVLANSEKILSEQEAIKERIIIERFIREAVKDDGLAVYGEVQVRDAINAKQADKVLLSEDLPHTIVTYKCAACNYEDRKIYREKPEQSKECPQCKSNMRIEKEEPLIEELSDLARQLEITVEIISTNTAEGNQFLSGFGGIGAFLRYRTR